MSAHKLLPVIAALMFCASGYEAQAAANKHHHVVAPQSKAKKPAVQLAPSTVALMQATAKMHRDMDMPFSGNADADYVRGMIVHHQGAVEMAEVVIAHGKDAFVRQLAYNIIQSQSREIAQLKTWLQRNKPIHPRVGGLRDAVTNLYKAANIRMHQAMNISYTGDADRDFITAMIPHHQGAIDMSRAIVNYGDDEFVFQLGYQVIYDQTAEISWMQSWLAKQGSAPASASSTLPAKAWQNLESAPQALKNPRLYP